MHQPTMDFGYNPPTGPRSMEKIRPSFFSLDLEKTLNIASNGFKSIWVSDHLNYTDEFRLECWTLLTWIAAKFPQFDLGTIVMCNSFRNPSLMAKMATTIQHLSNDRLILGYGAGWYAEEYKAFGFEYPKIKILPGGITRKHSVAIGLDNCSVDVDVEYFTGFRNSFV